MKRHIILVGLPGSGKTTVGRMLAEALQAGFVDVDTVIARKQGKPITMIFGEVGEGGFRTMERQEVTSALGGDACVIAPGGGWAAFEDNLATAADKAYVVYLKTRPESSVKRTDDPGGTRPMLIGDDPLQRLRDLLKEREPSYLKAQGQVETDKLTAEQVAAKVVELARMHAGW
jgi:shikimate kinase